MGRGQSKDLSLRTVYRSNDTSIKDHTGQGCENITAPVKRTGRGVIAPFASQGGREQTCLL